MKQVKINSVEASGTFKSIVDSCDPDVAKIATQLRTLISTIMPGVTEVPWKKQKTIGYGVGLKKMSEHFCYISPQKSYVNLGFMYGADLSDPDKILEGSGKSLRHIKVKSISDIKKPGIRKILKDASQHLPKL